MSVLFEIRRPWPKVRKARRPHDHVKWKPRWQVNISIHNLYFSPFLYWMGREFYWPSLITIWHVDRDAYGDDDSCRRHIREAQFTLRRRAQELGEEHKIGKRLMKISNVFWILFCHYHWFHPHHWRIQISPWQNFCRWKWSRCGHCGKRFTWGYAPASHCWNSGGPGFRKPEQKVYHFECSSAVNQKAMDERNQLIEV